MHKKRKTARGRDLWTPVITADHSHSRALREVREVIQQIRLQSPVARHAPAVTRPGCPLFKMTQTKSQTIAGHAPVITGPLRFSVFTQSDNYRKAPFNHIIRRWPGEIWGFFCFFLAFELNEGWRQRHCYSSRSAASPHRDHPSPSPTPRTAGESGPASHANISVGVCTSGPIWGTSEKPCLRPAIPPPPCSPTYSIPGSICRLLAAFQISEAHSVSLLSSQTADWQNKRQQLQFITSFIIQNPA